MRRVVGFFQEWYKCPGGMLLGIPVALAVVFGLVGGLGVLTLDLLAY